MAGGYVKLIRRGRRLRVRPGTVARVSRARAAYVYRPRFRRLDRAANKAIVAKQSFNFVPIQGYGFGLAQNHAYYFTIADIPDYSSYQQVFDQYKIIKVVIRFTPAFTSNDTSSQTVIAPGPPPSLTSYNQSALINAMYRICFDYDDSSAYSVETDYFQNATMKSMPAFGKGLTVTLYPKMKMDANNVTSVSVKPQWIDFDDTSVEHYGLKIWQPVTNTIEGWTEMKMTGTMYFACRNRQ